LIKNIETTCEIILIFWIILHTEKKNIWLKWKHWLVRPSVQKYLTDKIISLLVSRKYTWHKFCLHFWHKCRNWLISNVCSLVSRIGTFQPIFSIIWRSNQGFHWNQIFSFSVQSYVINIFLFKKLQLKAEFYFYTHWITFLPNKLIGIYNIIIHIAWAVYIVQNCVLQKLFSACSCVFYVFSAIFFFSWLKSKLLACMHNPIAKKKILLSRKFSVYFLLDSILIEFCVYFIKYLMQFWWKLARQIYSPIN
jgi:hypothetical protein